LILLLDKANTILPDKQSPEKNWKKRSFNPEPAATAIDIAINNVAAGSGLNRC
jgi:hypothetical protein